MGMELIKNFNCSPSIGDINSYIFAVNQIASLSFDEEQKLALKVYENKDREAAKILIMSNLKYVVNISKKYLGYGLALSDLIQEGNLGLIKSIGKFNPKRGVRLISFAIFWIKANINEYILKNWRIVKIATTKLQKKLFFNLRKVKAKIAQLEFSLNNKNKVSKLLGTTNDIIDDMEMRLNNNDGSIDNYGLNKHLGGSNKIIIELPDKSSNPHELLEHQDTKNNNNLVLMSALKILDERSKNIISSRWLDNDKKTLKDLSDSFNISLERVRQIEKSAMLKLKKHIIQSNNISSL